MYYIMSDIHGRKQEFNQMLSLIKFDEKHDTLYVLGDVLDYGKEPIPLLLQMMRMPNVHLLLGNHELYGILLLEYCCQDSKCESQIQLGKLLSRWAMSGAYQTVYQYKKLRRYKQKSIERFLMNQKYMVELEMNDRKYILAHSYMPVLDDVTRDSYLENLLLMERLDYQREYFQGKIFISGHTPTSLLGNDYKGKIFKNEYHINMDCGTTVLGCLCLDTMEEFYIGSEEIS